MSVKIIGDTTGTNVEVNATPKAMRAILYDAAGLVLGTSTNPIVSREIAAASFRGRAAIFRTLGNAAASQPIFTLENQAGSPVSVRVRALVFDMDATGASTALASEFLLSRTVGLPSAGTVIQKTTLDTTLSSDSHVVLRGATASDGGAATAITVTPAADVISRGFGFRMATSVGVANGASEQLVDLNTSGPEGLIVRANEAIVVRIVNPTAANNAATNHHTVVVSWEEFV